jgi:hypothetical protein
MRCLRLSWLGFMGTIVILSAPIYSQESKGATTPGTQPAATDTAPSVPSAETLRRANLTFRTRPELDIGGAFNHS